MRTFEHPFLQSVKEQWLEGRNSNSDNLEELVADHNSHERPDLKIPQAKDSGVFTLGYKKNNHGFYELQVGIVNQGDYVCTLKPNYSMVLSSHYGPMNHARKVFEKESNVLNLQQQENDLVATRNSWDVKLRLDKAHKEFEDAILHASEHLTEGEVDRYAHAADLWSGHYLMPSYMPWVDERKAGKVLQARNNQHVEHLSNLNDASAALAQLPDKIK